MSSSLKDCHQLGSFWVSVVDVLSIKFSSILIYLGVEALAPHSLQLCTILIVLQVVGFYLQSFIYQSVSSLGTVSKGLICLCLSVCLGAISKGLIIHEVDILLIPSQKLKMGELRILLQSQYKPKEGVVVWFYLTILS